MIVRLALRNLVRHTRRSVLTALGLAVALGAMLTMRSLSDGSWNSLVIGAIQSTAGHVVVQARGWQKERDVDMLVPEASAVAARLGEAMPGALVLRRTFVGGLLTSPTGAAAVMVEGVEPDKEAQVTLLDERLVEGAWLHDDRAILLGRELARTLGVGLGDKVVLMAQTGSPDVESRLYRVGGLFHTGSTDLDGFMAFASLDSTRELFGGADVAHQVAAVLPSAGGAHVDAEPARVALADRAGLEVLDWTQALPLLEQQRRLDESYSEVMYVALGFIVLLGLLNTVLMSVLERVREFGVMLAVGMRPRQLAAMVLVEGLVLGIVGSVLGLALGALGTWPLIVWGLDYGDLMADASPVAGVPVETTIRAEIDPVLWVQWALACAAVSALAAVVPARRATKLQPVDAIRHV